MLLAIFVICFFAFCLTVIITSNLKPKTTEGIKAKAEPLCSVDPDLADFEASLSGKPKSKRYAGKRFINMFGDGG